MVADLGFATQIGGLGFALVFLVLVILAVGIWLEGLVLKRIGTGKDEAEEKKEGIEIVTREGQESDNR